MVCYQLVQLLVRLFYLIVFGFRHQPNKLPSRQFDLIRRLRETAALAVVLRKIRYSKRITDKIYITVFTTCFMFRVLYTSEHDKT